MKHTTQIIMLTVLILGLGVQSVRVEGKNRQLENMAHELDLTRYRADASKRALALTQALQAKLMENKQVRTVTVTAYNPSEDQCDADPYVAASMRRVRPGTVAVSRDLFDQGWVFGKKIRIEGLGIFEINDLMNKRFTDRVDVFMWDEAEAVRFGAKTARAALLEI
jgi:3D (Asp-Asp-Asp) domain-containing protein